MVQCSEIWPFALSPSLGSSRQSLWAPWEQLQPWQNKYPHTYREWKSGPSVRQQGLCLFKFLHTTQLRRISPYSAVAHLINRKNCTFRKFSVRNVRRKMSTPLSWSLAIMKTKILSCWAFCLFPHTLVHRNTGVPKFYSDCKKCTLYKCKQNWR